MPEPDRILVVDDDPDIAETVQMILESRGYEVALAANGQEALDVIAKQRPDAILLDMLMPVMDGWQFAAELRRRYPHDRPPLIAMTAAEHARARALEIAADGWVKKPFEARTLVDAVAEAIARVASGNP